jgi:cytochrome c peroxidase
VDFYDRGGGVGIGLAVPNQTLPADALDLTAAEKQDLVAFMQALTDTVSVYPAPEKLPRLAGKAHQNKRLVGGRY